MSQTLLTGASGLIAHQRKLDIVANNLANLNTTSYKAQRILFSDLMYTNVRSAGAGDGNLVGGTNPQQTGFGVQVSQTNRSFGQGVLTATGSVFDFAIEGAGFFVTSNGELRYTRAGAFSLDANGFLVDPSNGAFVQRIGTIGEGLDGNPAFQVSGSNAIRVPLGAGIAGRATEQAAFVGNLPASATPPAAEVLASYQPFEVAGAPATLATLLNDLDSSQMPYIAGDQLRLQGFDFHGNPIDATLNVDGTTTMGDLVNFYNSVLVDAVASLDADGRLVVTADNVGVSRHLLELSDAPSNSGSINQSNHLLLEQVRGKDADTVETTIQVFDNRGQPQVLNVAFHKIDLNNWDVHFSLVDGGGTVIDGLVQRVEFSEQGEFLAVRGVGDGDSNIEIHFDSISTSQLIDIDFAALTHRAQGFTTSVNQDGYPPGNLVTVAVSASGVLEGIASNGRRVPIAQLAIANFVNPQGLEAVGQNYFRETTNSGSSLIGASAGGNGGLVRGGQLESSNVDVALEFTQLIVAQRGFSANARTITVASEVLQELVNLLR